MLAILDAANSGLAEQVSKGSNTRSSNPYGRQRPGKVRKSTNETMIRVCQGNPSGNYLPQQFVWNRIQA